MNSSGTSSVMGFVAICVCTEWPGAFSKLRTCLANYKCQEIPLGKRLGGLMYFLSVLTTGGGTDALRCMAAASVPDYIQYFSGNRTFYIASVCWGMEL